MVERFKQQSMYGLSVLTKKVAVVERWPATVVGRFAVSGVSTVSFYSASESAAVIIKKLDNV